MFHSRRVKLFSRGERLRLLSRVIRLALLERHKVKKTCRVTIRGGIPVRGATVSRTNLHSFRRGLHIAANRAAFRIYGGSPIELFGKANCREKLASRAIQNVEKTIAIGLDHQFSRLTCVIGIDQDGRHGAIVNEKAVWDELKVPLQLPSL